MTDIVEVEDTQLVNPTSDSNVAVVREVDWNVVEVITAGPRGPVGPSVPESDGSRSLGSPTIGWANLYLSSLATIDFGQGDVTLTHAADTLTLAGGTLVLPSAGLQVGSSVPFSDAAGTLTLQNVDALDATTESTIEAAIDTLANLSSIQGVSFTFGSYAATILNNTTELGFKQAVNLEIGVDVEAYDADLAAIAALAPSNDDIIQRKTGAWTNRTMAQLLTDLGAVGTTFQPLDTELTAIAGLTSAADKGIYFTGAGTAATYDLSSYGRTLANLADETALEALLDTLPNLTSIQGVSFTFGPYAATVLNNTTELGFKQAVNLEIGVDVQAYDADLTAWAGVNPSDYYTSAEVDDLVEGDPIVILATGQSNIALHPSYSWTPHDNVYLWNWDGLIDTTASTTGTAFAAMDATTINSAYRLADEIGRRNPARKVYLVNVGIGSQAIAQWMSGAGTPDMYDACKRNIEAALTAVGASKIDLMYWWQGESDGVAQSTTYLTDFGTVHTRFRTESWFPYGTPVLVQGVSPHAAAAYNSYYVNQWLRAICDADAATRTFVDPSQLAQSDYDSTAAQYVHALAGGFSKLGQLAGNVAINATHRYLTGKSLVDISYPWTAISGTINDHTPENFGSHLVHVLNPTGLTYLTGLTAQTHGAIRVLVNEGNYIITLQDSNAGSSAANRFLLGADHILYPTQSMALIYDSVAARWRPFSNTVTGKIWLTDTTPALANLIYGRNTASAYDNSITVQNLLKAVTLLTDKTTPASSDEVLIYDVSGAVAKKTTISEIQAAYGTVVGPASATDNAIARFDGTTGKLIQNSIATISDVGQITAYSNAAGVGALIAVNSTDSAAVQAALFEGFRATPAANDKVYNSFILSNASAVAKEFGREEVRGATVTGGAEVGQFRWHIMTAGTLTDTMILSPGVLVPTTNDGLALGSTSLMWSDLFLASGAVINFNNGDVTITHAANNLLFAGASSGYTFDAKVYPTTDDGAALGDTTHNFSDLFLASGAVINFNNGDVTVTHAANNLLFAGASSGYTFDAKVYPTADDGAALGDTTHNFSDLFLASGAVVNFNNGNMTITHAAASLTVAGGQTTFTSTTAGTAALRAYNTTDNAAVQGLVVEGKRATPAANDKVYITHNLADSAGNVTEFARTEVRANVVTDTSESGQFRWHIMTAGTLTDTMVLSAGVLVPTTNDSLALGTTSLMWSDLFLASGAVINFNAGDVTITHAANNLLFAGASSGYTFDAKVYPTADDGAALGDTTHNFSDLFLASGAVINFANGNMTITHSAAALGVDGGQTSFNSVVAGTPGLRAYNSTDNANVGVMTLKGNRATPAANDLIYMSWVLSDSVGTATEFGRMSCRAGTVTDGAEQGELLWSVYTSGAITTKMIMNLATLAPTANDGLALGVGALSWSDLFLASGAVINFNNGDVTITHAANNLLFAGASSGYTFDAKVYPTADDGAALGDTTHNFSDLFLASGAVINFNNGNMTITHAAAALTVAGGQSTFQSTTAGTAAFRAYNTTDNAAVQGAIVEGKRATPATDDKVYVSYKLADSGGNSTEFGRVEVRAVDITDTSEDGQFRWHLMKAGTLTDIMVLGAGVLVPTTNDSLALGNTSLMWADLFLASGAVVNFNNGNVTVTHSAGALAFAGAAITADNSIKSSSATAGIGYATGAGGTVTQNTNKSTGVTLNTVCGNITMNNAALAASTTVSFTLTNSAIAAADNIILNHVSAGTGGSYTLNAQPAAGSAVINVRNVSLASLSEAIVIKFTVLKAVTS